MSESSPRRRARELVLQALYAESIGEIDPVEVQEKVIVDESLSTKALDFARSLFGQVRENREWADGVISSLSKNWSIERMAHIDRSIMQIALVELKVSVDLPVSVVINEAIELARAFSTEESTKFINGILDAYVKGMPKEKTD